MAAGVGLAVGLEDVDGGLGAAHVGAFGDELGACVDEGLGFFAGDFVLRGAGEGDVDLADVYPGAGAGNVLEFSAKGLGGDQFGQLLALDLELGNQSDFLGCEAAVAVDDEGALAVGQGDDGGAQFDGLEGCVLSHVAGAGDGDALSGERLCALGDVLDHVIDVLGLLVSLRSI